MFEFLWPWIFFALPLPLLVYKFMPAKESKPNALFAPALISNQQSAFKSRQTALYKYLLLALIWISLVSASAQPFWLGDPVELPAQGRDLMLAVDLSGSMKESDMLIGKDYYTRIDALKYVLGDFIDKRQGDRLGLIVFGSQAYLHAPISYDRSTVKQFLHEAQIGFAGDKTSIGDAIGLAVKKLRDRPEESRILILVTDGANTAGEIEPLKAAEIAANSKIKIYTIGMGADEVIRRSFFGNHRVNPSRDLDEDTLSSIASMTSGQYFRARDPAELQEVYQLINELEPIDQEAETVRPKSSLFHYPLSLAVLAGFIFIFISKCLPSSSFGGKA